MTWNVADTTHVDIGSKTHLIRRSRLIAAVCYTFNVPLMIDYQLTKLSYLLSQSITNLSDNLSSHRPRYLCNMQTIQY